jgi:hypothetical protein
MRQGSCSVRSDIAVGRDGYQQMFDATLVGADRTKDLAVVQIAAPQVPRSDGGQDCCVLSMGL